MRQYLVYRISLQSKIYFSDIFSLCSYLKLSPAGISGGLSLNRYFVAGDLLVMKVNNESYLEDILTEIGSSGSPAWTQLNWDCDAFVAQSVSFYIAGLNGKKPITVDWGDSSALSTVVMDDTLKSISHVYAGTSVYQVKIRDSQNIKALTFYNENSPFSGSLTKDNVKNITAIDVNDIVGLAMDVDVTGMSKLQDIDSYSQTSFFHGNVTNTAIRHICIGTPNEFTGSLTAHLDYEYLDIYNADAHLSTITMDVTNLTSIWKLCSHDTGNRISGSLANLIDLEIYDVRGDNCLIDKPTTVINKPKLIFFRGNYSWDFTSDEVNQILADFVTNKDEAKRFPQYRYIGLDSGFSDGPTGQGIIDKALLEGYRSPTPPGTSELWDVNTNIAYSLGAELITGWTNFVGYAFETFVSSGKLITSAINSSGGGACYSNNIGAISVGDRFLLKYRRKLNSGSTPGYYIGYGPSLSGRSNSISTVDGDIQVIFTVTVDAAGVNNLVIETGSLCNFEISILSLKKII